MLLLVSLLRSKRYGKHNTSTDPCGPWQHVLLMYLLLLKSREALLLFPAAPSFCVDSPLSFQQLRTEEVHELLLMLLSLLRSKRYGKHNTSTDPCGPWQHGRQRAA